MRGVTAKIVIVWLTAILFVTASSVRAYEPQFADEAKRVKLRWKNSVIAIAFSNSLKNPGANFKQGSDVQGAIERSLATWERAANVKFAVSWTDKQSISPSGSAGDGVSLITVAANAENLAPFQGETSHLAGRTRVFYTKRGSINEADIVLNAYQQFSTDGTFGTFDLESALTHEIGHLLGLDHSSVRAATMYAHQGKNGTYSLPMVAPRTLAEDDHAGIRTLYGENSEAANCCGGIFGTISGEISNSSDLTVWAEEAETGRLIANASVAKDGSFQLTGLRAGKYQVFAQSAKANVNVSAEEIGIVNLKAGDSSRINAVLSSQTKTLDLKFVGFNAQLSTLAVPLIGGRSSQVYLGGNFALEDLAENGAIATNSPFLTINESSIMPQNYGANITVLSFQVDVSAKALKGEYSLKLQKKNGEIIYLPGCLAVDEAANDQQN